MILMMLILALLSLRCQNATSRVICKLKWLQWCSLNSISKIVRWCTLSSLNNNSGICRCPCKHLSSISSNSSRTTQQWWEGSRVWICQSRCLNKSSSRLSSNNPRSKGRLHRASSVRFSHQRCQLTRKSCNSPNNTASHLSSTTRNYSRQPKKNLQWTKWNQPANWSHTFASSMD